MLEKTMIPRTTGEMRALEERSSQAAIGVAERYFPQFAWAGQLIGFRQQPEQ